MQKINFAIQNVLIQHGRSKLSLTKTFQRKKLPNNQTVQITPVKPYISWNINLHIQLSSKSLLSWTILHSFLESAVIKGVCLPTAHHCRQKSCNHKSYRLTISNTNTQQTEKKHALSMSHLLLDVEGNNKNETILHICAVWILIMYHTEGLRGPPKSVFQSQVYVRMSIWRTRVGIKQTQLFFSV